MSDHCMKENELGKMAAILDKISAEVYGNGQLGLAKTVPRLEEKINTLVTATAAHTSVIANLVNYQTSTQGVKEGIKKAEEEKRKVEAKQLIAEELKLQKQRDKFTRVCQTIGAIIAFIGLATGIYFGFNKLNNNIKEEIKTELSR